MSFEFNPALHEDFYKSGHPAMLLPGTTLGYSNFTPRSTHREPKPEGVIWFGLQAWRDDYLIRQWNDNFFSKSRKDVVGEYDDVVKSCIGPDASSKHIGDLHDLGYLPILLKSLPEGTLIPYRVPALTIRSTHPKFAWLPNKLETVMSNNLWLPTTSATTSFGYRRVSEEFAKKTGAPKEFVQWQNHDFSMRGMEGLWACAASGAGHLLTSHGTDTVPAILFLKKFYGADYKKQLVGGSVTATEHFVTCAGSAKMGELAYLEWLITKVKPSGIISLVSDTWDLWRVLTDYLPKLKETILKREGKVVIRPDSGDPVDILCGDSNAPEGSPARLGVIRLLYKVFGGVTNAAKFIELDPHIGAIYGDSITPARQREILQRLMNMGFASSNIVFGVGSFTFQMVTRDTDGWAMKGTYVEQDGKGYNLSKSPVTDSGSKKSASGLLAVIDRNKTKGLSGLVPPDYQLVENCSWEQEKGGALGARFLDGAPQDFQTYSEICQRVESYL